MYLTEEEAKTKLCYRHVADNIPCVGSLCMAWRWIPVAPEQVTQKERPEGEGWVERRRSTYSGEAVWERPRDPEKGYCGPAEPTECNGSCAL